MRSVRLLVLSLAVAGQIPAPDAQAAQVQEITSCPVAPIATSVRVMNDLMTTGVCITIGASNITVDLNGFSLIGNAAGTEAGIFDSGGQFSGVHIKGGVVRRFNFGIDTGPKTFIRDLLVEGNTGTGIVLDDDSIVERTTVQDNAGHGIFMNDGARVVSVIAAANTAGTGVHIAGGSISRVTATSNSGNGISVGAAGGTVSYSSASLNGNDGISISGDGTRIRYVMASENLVNGIEVIADGVRIGSSVSSANQGHGVYVFGDAPALSGVRADVNGFAGGMADGFGDGIFLTGFTSFKVKDTAAYGNDGNDCPPFVC